MEVHREEPPPHLQVAGALPGGGGGQFEVGWVREGRVLVGRLQSTALAMWVLDFLALLHTLRVRCPVLHILASARPKRLSRST